MPATPTPIFGLPGPAVGDDANIQAAIDPLRQAIEDLLKVRAPVPIGAGMPYFGAGDPAAGPGDVVFLLADGRLVDRTVYATFFSRVGHAFNGGVDPGSNMVRLPDARGRALVGPDSMGTAQGAANIIPNSNRLLGQNGGEERHVSTVGESGLNGHTHTGDAPSHTHSGAAPDHLHFVSISTGTASRGGPGYAHGGDEGPAYTNHTHGGSAWSGAADRGLGFTTGGPSATAFTTAGNGGSPPAATPHNNMQPYLVSNMIVRVK